MPELPSNFELLSLEIQMYLNPELMKKKFDTKGIDRKMLKKYLDRLHILNQAFKKVKRYPLYFADFYPATEEITREEALEHHMHAYLTDLTILRHAIMTLLDKLKDDVHTVAPNKKDMHAFFTECKVVTLKRFNNVATVRNPHDHAQSRFLDEDNVQSGLLNSIIQAGKVMPELTKSVNAEFLKAEADKSFLKGKATRVKIAQDNAEGLTKLMDALFISLEDSLYRFLNIKPIIRSQIKKPKAKRPKDVKSTKSAG